MLILNNAYLLTLDEKSTEGWLSIAVADGVVAGVGTAAQLHARFPQAEMHSCRDRIIMPGLINAHLHPELIILKGLVEELDLHAWTDHDHFDPALAMLSAPTHRALLRAAIRASLADCLLTGTTCIATYGVTNGAEDICAAELRNFGLRGQITIRDVEFKPVPPVPDVAHMFRLHAEEALNATELEGAAATLRRGDRLVMHAAETEHRLRLCIEQFGVSTIRLLHRYGLLTERTLLSHAIYVDTEERGLLARHGVPIVSSPTAEMKLADGIAPIVEYLADGITVALGTDCAICNNSSDMFLEMRQLGLVQKLRYGAHSISAEQILRTATVGGAQALGLTQLGSVQEGWSADLIFVDTRNARLQPMVARGEYNNVAANLVFAATGQDVTDVMVGGEWLVRDRRLLQADPDSIWKELAEAADVLHERIF
jgi:cytosine/adenosine deaminase-related metal-dependent hydrolase